MAKHDTNGKRVMEVDLRGFRLSKLNTPEYSYLKWLLYWPIYMLCFSILERGWIRPYYHPTYCIVDDWIPFCEWFVIPYFLWYAWVPVFMIWFMLKSRYDYLKLCFVMLGGATICLVIYAIWPNGLDLRREITAHNFCAEVVRFLRSVDPPYNVCPSIHVSSTVSVHRIICQSRSFRDNKKMKWISRGVTWAICLSTMLIKQHSVIDVVCGWLLTEVMTVLYNGWRLLREIA